MCKIKKIEQFISEARQIHKDKYDYSKVKYINTHTKVAIICSTHGIFFQTPNKHLRGQGCSKCTCRCRATTEEFIAKAKQIHQNKYDYSKVKYINRGTKITIKCKEHGEFKQTPENHCRNRQGCPICGDKSRGASQRLTKEEFIQKAEALHGNKCDYSKVEYTNARTYVVIICRKHGEFKQSPDSHLRGGNCPKCNESKGEKQIREYLEDNNINYTSQYKFKNSNISRSLFDFSILKGMIEFQGQQHYFPVSFGSKQKNCDIKNLETVLKNDYKKEQFCKQNNIPLLIIPYWDKDRIPEILNDWINGKEPTFSEPPEIVVKHEVMRNEILNRIKNVKHNS